MQFLGIVIFEVEKEAVEAAVALIVEIIGLQLKIASNILFLQNSEENSSLKKTPGFPFFSFFLIFFVHQFFNVSKCVFICSRTECPCCNVRY